jgi:hypothetical protein
VLPSCSSPAKSWASIHIDGGVMRKLFRILRSSSVKSTFLLCAAAELKANKANKIMKLLQDIFRKINLKLLIKN